MAGIGCALVSCDKIPRDPEKTFERVQQGRGVRVGLVEHAPWVVRGKEGPAGVEVALVKEFCKSLGAKPEWHWGGEQSQMEALERFELDLLIGGITRKSPWRKRVGVTSVYMEEKVTVGAPRGDAAPEQVKGKQIAVESGTATAAEVKRKGAEPVRVSDLKESAGAVAAPDWKIEQLGLVPTKVKLSTEKHVIATPPGENRWIKQLDEFLEQNRGKLPTLLQEAEALR